jgi:hypothetical protein
MLMRPSQSLTLIRRVRLEAWHRQEVSTPLKLARDPVSVIWSPRNAAVRPAVAALVEALPHLLAF